LSNLGYARADIVWAGVKSNCFTGSDVVICYDTDREGLALISADGNIGF